MSMHRNPDPYIGLAYDALVPEDLARPQQFKLPEVPVREINAAGHVRVPGTGSTISFDKALADTGATANFISSAFVKRHNELFKPLLKATSSSVTLGDGNTRLKVMHELTLDVVVPSLVNDKEHVARKVRFLVIDMVGSEARDIVLGLPVLLDGLAEYLIERVERYVKRNAVGPSDVFGHLAYMALSMELPDPEVPLVEPWLDKLEEAPEDTEMTPVPATLVEHLRFLNEGREKMLAEYHEQIAGDKQLAEAFRKANPKIVELLLSPLAEERFVPTNWDGVKYKELELQFLPGMPDRIKPAPRFVNKKLFECAKEENDRLLLYMYQQSKSPIASPLVVAPKATKPFIRLCGDYRVINKYLLASHVYIPNVQHELIKAQKFKIFLDFDMVNAFHQRKLSPKSRQALSIQTPWGQIEPNFMPEGISVGSGELQTMVKEIFGDFEDWSIVMFDNILLLAEDWDDAYNKVEKFLKRCEEFNIHLKFTKTFLGFDSVKFFGYIVDSDGWRLDSERKQALLDVKMPTSKKGMQSFLGAANFFRHFTPGFAEKMAPLYDMTQESFCWDPNKWGRDYKDDFEQAKKWCADCVGLHFPDYDLPWILRTDASELGCGAVLLQVRTKDDGTQALEPLAFTSHKFSGAATRWSTIEQEGFGIFHAVKSLSYYLIGKHFVLETDHNNLLWMGASDVAKIQRWRIFLQSYSFLVRHIPGRQNEVADQLSRLLMMRDCVDSVPNEWLNEVCHVCEDPAQAMSHPDTLELLRAYLHDEIQSEVADPEEAQAVLDNILQEDESTADPRQLMPQLQRFAPMETPQYANEGEKEQGAPAAPLQDFVPRPSERDSIHVAVAVYDHELNKFLIGKDESPNANSIELWDLPTVTPDAGETLSDAAVRQLEDKTGLKVSRRQHARLSPTVVEYQDKEFYLYVVPKDACTSVAGKGTYKSGSMRWCSTEEIKDLPAYTVRRGGALPIFSDYLDEELDALLQDNECEAVAVLYDYTSGQLLLCKSATGRHELPQCAFTVEGDIPRNITEGLLRTHRVNVDQGALTVMPGTRRVVTDRGRRRTVYLSLVDFYRSAKFSTREGALPEGYVWMTPTELFDLSAGQLADYQLPFTHQAITEAVKMVRPTPELMLKSVHGGRRAHHGARRTWLLLNKEWPGHKIPLSTVTDWVTSCPVCQKARLNMTTGVEPPIRHIKPETHRSTIGIDTLKISPQDELGNSYIFVVTNHWSKHTQLYPVKEKSAETMAACLFKYFTTFGLCDQILTDPGSEFDNKLIPSLEAWFGIKHVFSLVGRHQSNGVERTNRKIIDYLRALSMDERVGNRWSHPTVLPWVEYQLNSQVNGETNFSAWQLLFGTAESAYYKLRENGDLEPAEHEYVRELDANLQAVRDFTRKYQAEQALERTTTEAPAIHLNSFEVGDYVLRKVPQDKRTDKLKPVFRGPYSVLSVNKADYTCRHMATGATSVLHASELGLWLNNQALSADETRKVAREQAMIDYDEYEIVEIVSYRGNPHHRQRVEFLCRWADGDLIWRGFGKDLEATTAFGRFLEKFRECHPLSFRTAEEAAAARREMRNTPFQDIDLNRDVWIPIRTYSWPDDNGWYERLPTLPNKETANYFVKGRVRRYTKTIQRIAHAQVEIPVFGSDLVNLDRWDYRLACYPYLPEGAIEIDQQWTHDFPELLLD